MSLPFRYQHSCITGDALAVSTCRNQVVGGGGWPGTQWLISNTSQLLQNVLNVRGTQ